MESPAHPLIIRGAQGEVNYRFFMFALRFGKGGRIVRIKCEKYTIHEIRMGVRGEN
jgi:hypothetical protein